ncbi:hypothetical protein E1218_14975 [Kribbella turkmenica]|uniref:Uncharacterized protein n=1 Tax=Kribbella turkmenica TaxID=2530375 RepID=A0A4R4X4Z1_9ACTN|nr:hypothetical protein [Kribbella turkmenica]TDD25393.1 hypothetical protein E1218_14975 [Kribbella turkmenica]
METDPDTVVPRRLSEGLHGATLLTLHCDAGRPGKPFGANVVTRLGEAGLLGHVLWSTSCAPRDVDADVFRDLRDSGLYLVRLELDGIAGDAARLRELVVVVHSLRQLGLLVTYDLDLFDGRLRENLVVLRTIVADGTIPAVFRCGPVAGPLWLQRFRDDLVGAVAGYLELSGQLADAWADVIVGERLLRGLKGVAAHRIALQRLTLRVNLELLDLVGDSLRDHELHGRTPLLAAELIGPRVDCLTDSMLALRNRFLSVNAASLPAGRIRR